MPTWGALTRLAPMPRAGVAIGMALVAAERLPQYGAVRGARPLRHADFAGAHEPGCAGLGRAAPKDRDPAADRNRASAPAHRVDRARAVL